MKITDNPFEFMEDAAKEFPELKDVNVYVIGDDVIYEGEKHSASVQFSKDGCPPVIYLKYYVKICEVPFILAHEMAHILAGKDELHSVKWIDAQTKVLKAMNRYYEKIDKNMQLQTQGHCC